MKMRLYCDTDHIASKANYDTGICVPGDELDVPWDGETTRRQLLHKLLDEWLNTAVEEGDDLVRDEREDGKWGPHFYIARDGEGCENTKAR